MNTVICPCNGTGLLGDRFCTCEAGYTLRVHIETSSQHAEFRRRRAQVDHMLARMEENPLPRGVWSANGDHAPRLGTPLGTGSGVPDDPTCN